MKDLGAPTTFLGLEIARSSNSLFLHQSAYTSKLLQTAGLSNSSPAATPHLTPSSSTPTTEPFNNPSFFRRLAGSLQYLTITRPDIAFSVNVICQHMHSPTTAHYTALVRILRYLKGTISYGLSLRFGSCNLTVYSDWAGDRVDRKSTTGYCFFLGSTLISWHVHKQRTVARSSTEAEYRSLATAVQELIWLRRLLQDFNFLSPAPAKVFCDNRSALAIASNPVLHARTKHIEIDRHFVREQLQLRTLELHHLPSTLQIADILTKPLQKSPFKRHCDNLTITPLDRYLEGGSQPMST